MAWVGARDGAAAAVVGGAQRLLRLVHPLRALPAAPVRLDRGRPRGGRRSGQDSPGEGHEGCFPGRSDLVALLAHIMGLRPRPDEVHLTRLSPEGLQRASFAAIRAVVARLVANGPTVLALEDLHWADPTSLRLTQELAALARDGPLFVVATRRPEPDPGVTALESSLAADAGYQLRRLELSPLSEQAERELARSLIGDGAPDPVVDALCASVDGNPLFLEERLSSLLETGALVRGDGRGTSAGAGRPRSPKCWNASSAPASTG